MLLSIWRALKRALGIMPPSTMPARAREKKEVTPEPPQERRGATAAATATPVLPLWQRRILMGERCELPRFSGLILYDERGRPVGSSSDFDRGSLLEVKLTPALVPATTLKDLL